MGTKRVPYSDAFIERGTGRAGLLLKMYGAHPQIKTLRILIAKKYLWFNPPLSKLNLPQSCPQNRSGKMLT